jgi:hypothetical protein
MRGWDPDGDRSGAVPCRPRHPRHRGDQGMITNGTSGAIVIPAARSLDLPVGRRAGGISLISRAAACLVPWATLRAYQSALRAAGITCRRTRNELPQKSAIACLTAAPTVRGNNEHDSTMAARPIVATTDRAHAGQKCHRQEHCDHCRPMAPAADRGGPSPNVPDHSITNETSSAGAGGSRSRPVGPVRTTFPLSTNMVTPPLRPHASGRAGRNRPSAVRYHPPDRPHAARAPRCSGQSRTSPHRTSLRQTGPLRI